jgi:hypothetical protein
MPPPLHAQLPTISLPSPQLLDPNVAIHILDPVAMALSGAKAAMNTHWLCITMEDWSDVWPKVLGFKSWKILVPTKMGEFRKIQCGVYLFWLVKKSYFDKILLKFDYILKASSATLASACVASSTPPHASLVRALLPPWWGSIQDSECWVHMSMRPHEHGPRGEDMDKNGQRLRC